MSLLYVIDGYNIIRHPLFKRGSGRCGNERIALLEFIRARRLTGSPNNMVTVVFDGYPDALNAAENNTGIKVIFSREETADAEIKKIVELASNPKNTVVISDDKEIRFFARSAGARRVSVEEFIAEKTKSTGLNKEALECELSYTQMQRINQELRKIWLK